MTEEAAIAWIAQRFGETMVTALHSFVVMIQDETQRQNLISAASMESIWARHIVDSAQLIDLASPNGRWVDIGTGAGFPGIVTGLLTRRETILVEPRRRRVEFLQRAVYELDLGSHVEVRQTRIETVNDIAGVISARAVASIDALLTSASNCSDSRTQWLLPKGRNALEEVAQAEKSWHGAFHVEHSVTDPRSLIVVASGIARR